MPKNSTPEGVDSAGECRKGTSSFARMLDAGCWILDPPTHPIHHEDTKDTKVSRRNSFVFGKTSASRSEDHGNWRILIPMRQVNTDEGLGEFLVILVPWWFKWADGGSRITA
jgi:hypothetical protein